MIKVSIWNTKADEKNYFKNELKEMGIGKLVCRVEEFGIEGGFYKEYYKIVDNMFNILDNDFPDMEVFAESDDSKVDCNMNIIAILRGRKVVKRVRFRKYNDLTVEQILTMLLGYSDDRISIHRIFENITLSIYGEFNRRYDLENIESEYSKGE